MYKNLLLSAKLANDVALKNILSILKKRQINISYICDDINISHSPDTLYLGTGKQDYLIAKKLNLNFALCLWTCSDVAHIHAQYYFRQPYDIINILTMIDNPYINRKWLQTAMEMQFIAQAGLTYTKDIFDKERFTRLSEMAAEIMSDYVEMPVEKVKDLFCNETGFQTPKLDTRSAIFKDDKILLVKELDNRWSLPGGWVDVNQSIADNLIKEAYEEAGVHVVPTRLVAIHDRNRHNIPLYAYGIIKIFMLCELIDGEFINNIETSESAYFTLSDLPNLSLGKNTFEQIELCFAANKDKNWVPIID